MTLNLGKKITFGRGVKEAFEFPISDLLTHAFICGSTGSGKTVLGKVFIEETARRGIPSIIVDLKGDLASLAVPILNLNPQEFAPWIDAHDEESRLEGAKSAATTMRRGLQGSGIDLMELQDFRQKTQIQLYTPRSNSGIPVSISLLTAPEGIEELFNDEPEIALAAVKNAANAVFGRLYPNTYAWERLVESCLLEEMISLLWKKGFHTQGFEAISELVQMIIDPPVLKIGAMEIEDFLPRERRLELARRLNALALGSEKLWYEGITIDELIRDTLRKDENGATKVSILYLGGLDHFSDRAMVVAQLCYALHAQLRKKPAAALPRIILYLDEIGGSGGEAFYPPEPFESLSKPAISLLVRQGRAYGGCCILATQNPGDIDYRGLTNCQSWFIGRLQTAQDRELVMQGISQAQFFIDRIDSFLRSAEPGQFIVKLRKGTVEQFQERWLLSYHSVIPPLLLPQISKVYKGSQGYLRARHLAEQGNIQEALSEFDSLIKNNPDDGMALSGKAQILMNQNRSKEAADLLEKALENMPDNSVILALLGHAYLDLNQPEKALSPLSKAMDIISNDEKILTDLGLALFLSGQEKEANEIMDKALNINTKNHKAWHIRGAVSYNKGDFNSATSLLSKALDQNPSFDTHFLLASSFYGLGNYEESIKHFESALQLDPSSISARYGLALALIVEKPEKAQEELKAVVEKVPDYLQARIALGGLYLKSGENNLAQELLARALPNDDPDFTSLYAQSLFLNGQFDKAIEQLGLSLANNKKRGDLWLLLSQCYSALKKFNEAERAGKNAVLLLPKDSVAFLALARAQWGLIATVNKEDKQQRTQISEILKNYDKAAQLNPNCGDAWYEAGLIMEKCDQHYEASDYYRRALEADPQHIEAREKKGHIALLMDRPDLALQSFRSARNMAPHRLISWLGEAESLKRQRQYEEALEILDQAENRFENEADYWHGKAMIFKEINEEEKASICLAKANDLKNGKTEDGSDEKKYFTDY